MNFGWFVALESKSRDLNNDVNDSNYQRHQLLLMSIGVRYIGEWFESVPGSPLKLVLVLQVAAVAKAIESTGLDMLLDVHGDEEIPANVS